MGVSLIICPSAVWWWLRSPNYNNNNNFCITNTDGSNNNNNNYFIVNSDGNYNNNNANASGGLLPGFCYAGSNGVTGWVCPAR